MNFLPVIARELQVQARQPATNRMRWMAAAAVIVIWLFLMLASGNAAAHERAKITFIAISIVSLGGVMLAGIFQTADCLSEERREGTLGLLFLTDLRGYDVVLGKLASTSVHTFFALLAIVPVLSLPLLMGGMTAGEFWRVTLVLVVTLYLSLSVGILISALSRDTRGAMLGTFLVMLVLAGVLPLVWGLTLTGRGAGRSDFLLLACPPFAYQRAFELYYSMGRGAGVFWQSILTLATLGTGSLVAACLLLPRVWQENGSREGAKAKSKSSGLNPSHNAARSVTRGQSPFEWLVLRDRRTRRTTMIVFLVLLTLWFIFFAGGISGKGMAQGVSFSFAMFLAYGLHLVLKCLVALETSRRLSEDRQSGALELLLVTPLPVADIIAGQVAALWRVFRWQLLALTCVNLCLLAVMLNQAHMNGEAALAFTLVMLGGVVMLFLDFYAMTRVGIWMALTKKRHASAFLGTMLRVLLPAWLAAILMLFLSFAGAALGGPGTATVILFFWFFICGFVDVVQAAMATADLGKRFREVVALGRAESKPPGWNSSTAQNSK